MLVCGAFVNGPYALITTAVSADLGSHPSLKGDLTLTATVTGACMKFFGAKLNRKRISWYFIIKNEVVSFETVIFERKWY